MEEESYSPDTHFTHRLQSNYKSVDLHIVQLFRQFPPDDEWQRGLGWVNRAAAAKEGRNMDCWNVIATENLQFRWGRNKPLSQIKRNNEQQPSLDDDDVIMRQQASKVTK